MCSRYVDVRFDLLRGNLFVESKSVLPSERQRHRRQAVVVTGHTTGLRHKIRIGSLQQGKAALNRCLDRGCTQWLQHRRRRCRVVAPALISNSTMGVLPWSFARSSAVRPESPESLC